MQDLTGREFNSWKVLRYLGNRLWECECKCGEIRAVQDYALTHNKSKSCGKCNKVKFNAGDTVGSWTVVTGEIIDNKVLCECECGTRRMVSIYTLKNGKSTSCGCKKNTDKVKSPVIKPNTQYNFHKHSEEPQDTPQLNELHGIIKGFGIDRIELNKFILGGYQIDLYIPDKKVGIEFNGDYWHSEQYKDPKYHQIKSAIAKRNGIRLIHIYEYEWIDRDKREKIINILNSILTNSNRVIYARSADIVEVTYNEIKEFLDTNHLQGSLSFRVGYALRYQGEIIGVMTFGAPRFDLEHDWELLRLCWKDGVSCVGGAERLFKEFIRKNHPNSIISYCNIDKFTGGVYTRLGFKFNHLSKPGYVWWQSKSSKSEEVIPRTAINKAKLVKLGYGTEDETEPDIMHRLGYLRIYDSGNLVYSWSK